MQISLRWGHLTSYLYIQHMLSIFLRRDRQSVNMSVDGDVSDADAFLAQVDSIDRIKNVLNPRFSKTFVLVKSR